MPRWTALLVVVLTACGGSLDSSRTQPPPVPVGVTRVEQRDVPLDVRAIGNVEAFSTVSVKSQVEGQLAEVRFKEGDEVKVGDLLFVIDPAPFQAALDQAQANLARATAEAKNAEVQAARFAALARSGIVSKDEHDRVATQAASMGAAVDAARAAVENVKLRLDFCYLRSPIDGRVGRLLVHQGNVVKEKETTLAVVNQLKPIYVTFAVPEQELPEIRRHQADHPLAVTVTLADTATPPVQGTLSFIDNAVDTTTGTVILKGIFPNVDEVLWPGQFVNAALTLDVERNAVVVPAAAVQTGQEGSYVFVVKVDETVEYRPIKVVRSAGQLAVVESGLAAGETIVTQGFVRLAPGVKVTIRQPEPGGVRTGAAE